MKVIALRNFLNVHNRIRLSPDQKPLSDGFIHKGAIFDIGSDAKYKGLMPEDQKFIAELNLANCIGDATDPKIVEAVNRELVADGAAIKAASSAKTRVSATA